MSHWPSIREGEGAQMRGDFLCCGLLLFSSGLLVCREHRFGLLALERITIFGMGLRWGSDLEHACDCDGSDCGLARGC